MEISWLQGTEFERLPALATSLAIGLLIGLERERHPDSKAGLRTFSLVALFGAICALLGERSGSPAMLVAGALLVGAMIIAAYARDDRDQEPGTTTIIALLLCYVLAVMVWIGFEAVAVMLAIVMTSLLYFKAELRGVAERLERRDLVSILQFCVLSFIVLPILPDRDYGPYGTLNPYEIWTVVVLISGVSLAGYVALRLVGPRHGAPLLGLFGGMVSSTATTLVYSRHGAANPSLRDTAALVIVLANLVVLLRLGVLATVVSPSLLGTMLPVLGGGLLPGLASLVYLHLRLRESGDPPVPSIKNPTELRTALGFAALYAVVLILTAWVSDKAGSAGLYTLAILSGLTDVDAITLSAMRLHNNGDFGAGQVVGAIVLAIIANIVFKLGVVLTVGGKDLFRRCAGPMAVVAAGLSIVAILMK